MGKFRRTLVNRVLVPASAAASTGKPVHFLHVAKTGGTAIKAALAPSKLLKRVSTPTHTLYLRDHEIRLSDIPEGQSVIFGVRDPARRFVSGFYSRLRGGRKGRNIDDPRERAVFEQFKTPRDLARDLYSEDAARREAAQNAVNAILHTRVKLADWLGSPAELERRRNDILFVYQQEGLDQDFATLSRILSLSQAALPTDDVAAHRLKGDWDTSLDDLARENLRKWYASDYEIIAACKRLFTPDGRMRA
jgi:hypothetical protein